MKKSISIIAALALCACMLTGCQCSHEWIDADCTTAKTCTKCEVTAGEALGHSWEAASCAAPKTCFACGLTEGEPLPHTLTEANFQQAPTCTVCGAVEGEPLEAGFETLGIDARFVELGVPTTLTIAGAKYSFTVESHETDVPNDAHETVDRYVWHTIKTKLELQENQPSPGTQDHSYSDFSDYYTPTEQTASVAIVESDALLCMSFTANYMGQDYPDCMIRMEYAHLDTIDGNWVFEETMAYRIPAGYDGLVVAMGDSAIMQGDYSALWQEFYSNENTALYRVK